MTRNPESPKAKQLAEQGVELVAGEYDNAQSMLDAASGADAAFVMATPFEKGVDTETAQAIAMCNAVRDACVGHLVYSSVASADRDTGIPHFESKYKVEEHLKTLGVNYTVVAPVFFMENIYLPNIMSSLREGVLSMAMPGTRKLQQVALADIGAFTAAVIERGQSVFGQRFDIAGDELTPEQEAGILSRITGREIRYEGYSPDVMRPEYENMAVMFEWFNTIGYDIDIAGLRRDFPEVGWHDFEQWVQGQNLGI